MKIVDLMSELKMLYPQAFPKAETSQLWARRYRKQLGGFEGEALQSGFDRCIDRWEKNTFPKPSDILSAIPEKYFMERKAKSEDWRIDWPRVEHIMRSDIGQMALREGWGHSVMQDAKDGKIRAPIDIHPQKYRTALAGRYAALPGLQAKGDAMSLMLVSLSHTMDEKNAKYASKYLV